MNVEKTLRPNILDKIRSAAIMAIDLLQFIPASRQACKLSAMDSRWR